MKQQPLLIPILAVAALLSITGFAQKNQEASTLEERVQALEAELGAIQGSVAGLTAAVEQSAAATDTIHDYLRNQAASAKNMVSTLAKSEDEGFTAGINFTSREILLAGWREQLSATQADVPGAPVKQVAKKVLGRR